MAEIEIKSNIKLGLNDILKAISTLETKDIEIFLKEVTGILAQKKEKESKNLDESALIKQIKSAYPIKLNKRYQSLRSKVATQQLSEKEQKELIELTNHFEALDAQRLQYLMQLAQLRGTSLNVIVKEFSTNAYP